MQILEDTNHGHTERVLRILTRFKDDYRISPEEHFTMIWIVKVHSKFCVYVDCPCRSLVSEDQEAKSRNLKASSDCMMDFLPEDAVNLDVYRSSSRNSPSGDDSLFFLTEEKVRR